ncbi:MAG TPA: flagellar basal-body MS-ring/collar protein FliF [Caulobacteraceae bacterium]
MQSFIEALQRFGIGRLGAIVGVAAGVAAALFALVLNVGTQPKALLYSNLDLKEAGQITQALDQAGVKYDVKGDGSTIMVPRDKVASTRIMLSSKGMPTSGSVGYEIFDTASPLGQTDFVQNLNRQRALEGELARTIRSLQGVSSARVHLVLPRRQLFEGDGEAPSASVVIGVAGRSPGADQVAAVRNLIAGAVPNLKPDRVTVVDERGKLLAGVGDGDGQGSSADTTRADTEERMRKTIKDLVEGVVGAGKARVQVTADLDRNRVTLQEEKYDPDGQVVRSTQTVGEKANQNSSTATSSTSAAANIPGGANGSVTNSEPGNTSDSARTEETTNYEISKSTRTEVIEPGQVKRLSVAVAVDGVTTLGAKGKTSYAPRSADEMKRIDELVRSAVGFSAQRGDVVSVINVRFDHGDEEGAAAGNPLLNFDKNDMMRMAELGVLLVMAALVVFFVVRPLLATAAGGGSAGLPMLAAAGAGGGSSALTVSDSGVNMVKAGPAIADSRIDIAKIEGAVKASSVKQVAEFVDSHPEESVSILRAWLHEGA